MYCILDTYVVIPKQQEIVVILERCETFGLTLPTGYDQTFVLGELECFGRERSKLRPAVH